MIVLQWLFLTLSPCDAAEPWQLGSQDAATPIMQGIIDLHHDIFFFLILILVFVLWILVRALWHFPLAVIHLMVKRSRIASSSSSSSSSSNKKRNKKRKKKEDLITNLVVEEVERYLERHKDELMAEFPRAFPYLETTDFLTKVSSDLLRGAGLANQAEPLPMGLLHMITDNFIESFDIVRSMKYKNNIIYDSVRCLLRDYR